MVLIRDEGDPRLQWPLAIVTKLYPGRDGLIRAVDLRTAKYKISRPIQKLHKLEMFEEQINKEELQGATKGDSNVRPRGRPRGRWRDLVDRDMRELRVVPEDADDRLLETTDPDRRPLPGIKREKRREEDYVSDL
ncbi:Pao retrotransposon peptidase superfamily [Elysia marginata]|uniref:Pao retrotransposon peptidase superfamily n=1 Tax=Elysia marginata TaxID=1093978 RepID=A0AAV4JEF4_9GAST|nr:Pao retrotransposon peptidase superfamily [Elysia marginata]